MLVSRRKRSQASICFGFFAGFVGSFVFAESIFAGENSRFDVLERFKYSYR